MNRRTIGFFVFGLLFAISTAAHAQTGGAIGIGPRVTFQSGDQSVPNSSALRVLGGQFKLRLSPSTAIEVAADYESKLNESLTQRARTMPIQASVLVFPIHTVVAPYVLGGLGWYHHSLTSASGAAGSTTTSIREMGYHAGLGAEVRVGSRMAIHGDYRYNHIRFGGDGNATQAQKQTASAGVASTAVSAVSLLPKLSAIQESLKLSSQGSMWNWGVTFFF